MDASLGTDEPFFPSLSADSSASPLDGQPLKRGAYRHFKGRLYWVFGIARHSETQEPMVVYRALYGDAGLWVRPLPLFMSGVDKEKYPDASQELRFEKVDDALGEAAMAELRSSRTGL